MGDPVTTRCSDCGAEFTELEIVSADECPACGSTAVPILLVDVEDTYPT